MKNVSLNPESRTTAADRYAYRSLAARPTPQESDRPALSPQHRPLRPHAAAPRTTRIAACQVRLEHRPRGILLAGTAAITALDNAYNKVVFGLFAACGAVMGATCFWNLSALVGNWDSFVQNWAGILHP